VILPVMAVSMPFGDIPKNIPDTLAPQVVSTKINIGSLNLFAFNTVEDEEAKAAEVKAKLLKTRAEAIDAFFEGRDAPLAGMGMKMVEEADKNGLDWRLIPAIATIESNAGKQACKKVTHSFLGWGSCKINFESKEKAIEIVSWNLGGNNPKTSRYYKGKTTEEILRRYNPPEIVPDYNARVIKVMGLIGDKDLGEENNIQTKIEA